jgi:hypothetical protein
MLMNLISSIAFLNCTPDSLESPDRGIRRWADGGEMRVLCFLMENSAKGVSMVALAVWS